MSRPAIFTAVLMALVAASARAEPVEERREWNERFDVTLAEPTLEVRNIWGDVVILPGAEGEITLAIREHRTAPDQALFERSLQVYGLDIRADGQGVEVRVGRQDLFQIGRDYCRNCRVDYQFEIRVPPETKVNASTVNDGRVEISKISGRISAANVNGPVTIRDARACETVNSVNGEVIVGFGAAPGSDCSIETINGDISLQVPAGSGLDLAVDLGNGRVTSELAVDPIAIPARVEHTRSGASNHYRIEQAAGVRLAGGGPVFSVTSMNGDLRIQKLK